MRKVAYHNHKRCLNLKHQNDDTAQASILEELGISNTETAELQQIQIQRKNP